MKSIGIVNFTQNFELFLVIFDNFLEFFHQNRGYVALSGVHIPVTYLPELLRETVHKIYEFIILMFKIIDLTVRTQNVLRTDP